MFLKLAVNNQTIYWFVISYCTAYVAVPLNLHTNRLQ